MEIVARLHAKVHVRTVVKEVKNQQDAIIALLHVAVHALVRLPLLPARDAVTVVAKHAHNLVTTHVEPDASIHVLVVVTRRVWVGVIPLVWAVVLNTANTPVRIHLCLRDNIRISNIV